VRVLAAVVIAVVMFAMPRSAYELRCFLHCHGEGETEIRSLGIPAAYWSRDVVPGDPPIVGPDRFDPVAFVLDVLALGLVLCALAIASSAVHRPARLDLRAQLPTIRVASQGAPHPCRARTRYPARTCSTPSSLAPGCRASSARGG
jgi:hypothetical protein